MNKSFKIGLFTFVVTLIGFLATSFLIFMNSLIEVPLGIALGGTFFGSLSLISGLMEEKDDKEKTNKFSIIIIILRFLLSIALIVGVALLYYLADIKVFNLFAVVAMYTVNVIITIVIYLINKN